MVTVWSKRAKAELHKAYLYILLDSLQNARMVRDDIIDARLIYPNTHKNIRRINSKRTMTECGGHLKNITTAFHTGLCQMKSA
jgi:hypothetical protein